MSFLTKNQTNLTIIYLISILAQFIGYLVVCGGVVEWKWVAVYFVTAFVSCVTYYKIFSD